MKKSEVQEIICQQSQLTLATAHGQSHRATGIHRVIQSNFNLCKIYNLFGIFVEILVPYLKLNLQQKRKHLISAIQ